MNQTNERPSDIEVIWRGDEMEPGASVAPEGDVTLQLLNSTDSPHDFALVRVEEDEAEWRDRNEPVRPDDIQAVGLVEVIPAWGARAVTWPLTEGHYLLISNTPGDHLHASVLELTVQPVESE